MNPSRIRTHLLSREHSGRLTCSVAGNRKISTAIKYLTQSTWAACGPLAMRWTRQRSAQRRRRMIALGWRTRDLPHPDCRYRSRPSADRLWCLIWRISWRLTRCTPMPEERARHGRNRRRYKVAQLVHHVAHVVLEVDSIDHERDDLAALLRAQSDRPANPRVEAGIFRQSDGDAAIADLDFDKASRATLTSRRTSRSSTGAQKQL